MVEPAPQGCSHYSRNCLVQAPCCNLFYPCKLCHDELYKGPKAEWCKVERMQFDKVPQLKCLNCDTIQPPAENCINCSVRFGTYGCLKCRLFENNEKKAKDIFHCDECGMCRRGKREENTHCKNCGYCIHISSYDTHLCRENKVEADCPICMENLKFSTRYWVPMDCGHLIHQDCLKLYLKTNINCPICGKSWFKMEEAEKKAIEQAIEQSKDNIPSQLKGKKVNIFCHECTTKTNDVDFHFFGFKCGQCGTYNTKMI